MSRSETINFTIQPVGSVVRDIVDNKLWILGFAFILTIWIVASSLLFRFLEQGSQSLSWVDSLYFTTINLTTVGFGDIAPKSEHGRYLAMANSIFGVVSIGVFVAVITVALQPTQFAGRGAILHTDQTSATTAHEDETTISKETLRLVESLNALVDEYPDRHRHLSLRVQQSGSKEDREISIEVHVFVHRRT